MLIGYVGGDYFLLFHNIWSAPSHKRMNVVGIKFTVHDYYNIPSRTYCSCLFFLCFIYLCLFITRFANKIFFKLKYYFSLIINNYQTLSYLSLYVNIKSKYHSLTETSQYLLNHCTYDFKIL